MFRYLTQFQGVNSLKTRCLKRQCAKSGKKMHLRSSKCDINPLSQKYQDPTTQSLSIFKQRNQSQTTFLEVKKYEEVVNFLGGIDFIWRI